MSATESQTTKNRASIGSVLFCVDLIYLAVATGFVLSLLLWLGEVVVSHKFTATISENPYFFLDYIKYYVFTKVTWFQGSQLYDPHTQWYWTERVLNPAHLHQLMFSEYPPFTGIILSPLILLPVNWGYAVWLAFLLGIAVLPLVHLSRHCLRQATITVTAIFVACAASVSGEWATLLGQLNWAMVGMISLLFVHFLRIGLSTESSWQDDLIPALALAFMSLKPQYAVFFLAPVLAMKRWRLLLFFVLSEVILLLVAMTQLGFFTVAGYPVVLYQALAKGQVAGVTLPDFFTDPQFSVSSKRLFDMILPNGLARWAGFAAYFAGMVAVGFGWARWSRVQAWRTAVEAKEEMNGPRPDTAAPNRRETSAPNVTASEASWLIACTVIAFLVVNPHCHLHDCVSLAVAAVATVPFAGLHKIASGRRQLSTIVWQLLLYAYPLGSWAVFLLLPSDSIWRSMYFLAMNVALLLVALKWWHATAQRQCGAKRNTG